MNNCIYKLNMRVDEYGERIQTYTDGTARIISGDCMIHEPEWEVDEENDYYDRYGNCLPGPIQPAKLIPVQEIVNAFYFQWRIDGLRTEDSYNPRVIVGVCRDSIMPSTDLNRSNDCFGLSLATGDVLVNRRWKDFYPAEEVNQYGEPCPPKGVFTVGTTIGVLVDMDRGIIAFYKDNEDLGTACV